jgi:CRP/FNR family transcriptional regulator, transcriptional activator FtrB
MPQTNRHTAQIERSPFFQAAGSAAMAELLAASFTQLLPRNAVLFEQGDEPEVLHLVLEGRLGLQAQGEAGTRTIVEIFGPGEILLAPAVVLSLPYLASAVALTKVRVTMMPAKLFRDTLARSLPLARATTELLARHWRLMVDQVVDLKLRDAEQRVARFIARRVSEEEGAAKVVLNEPRGAIAARLGMTPETLSRALAALEAKGKLRRAPDGATIADRTALGF